MIHIPLHGNPGSNDNLLKRKDLTDGEMATFRQMTKFCTKCFLGVLKAGTIDTPFLRRPHLQAEYSS
jgi:hypothetical protein